MDLSDGSFDQWADQGAWSISVSTKPLFVRLAPRLRDLSATRNEARTDSIDLDQLDSYRQMFHLRRTDSSREARRQGRDQRRRMGASTLARDAREKECAGGLFSKDR